MKISVIGSGYVGLVTGACLSDWGHHVVCVDRDAEKIASLNTGVIPIYEPELEILVRENAAKGRLTFTRNLADAVSDSDVVFIAVGTPPRPADGEADLSYVYDAAREIAGALRGYTVIVDKSTVPIGTGDVVEHIVSLARPDADFSVVSNPEFLREGSAIADFTRPDRVVIGTEEPRARAAMLEVYERVEAAGLPILVTKRRTAELIKYTANAFLATKLTFINEMADLCEHVGADIDDVAQGVGLDTRIGDKFLKAGPGYGGSCFPKDTLALLRTAQDHGVALRLVEDTVSVNEARKRRMALKVIDAAGGSVTGKTIAVLGLTFKANTDDMRASPSIPLVELLQRAGAHVRAYDPEGMDQARMLMEDVEFSTGPYECAANADAVVLMTDWHELTQLDLDRLHGVMRSPAFIDLRNAYAPELLEAHGFTAIGIGRSSKSHPDSLSPEPVGDTVEFKTLSARPGPAEAMVEPSVRLVSVG